MIFNVLMFFGTTELTEGNELYVDAYYFRFTCLITLIIIIKQLRLKCNK